MRRRPQSRKTRTMRMMGVRARVRTRTNRGRILIRSYIYWDTVTGSLNSIPYGTDPWGPSSRGT